ncbi:nitrogen regulatory protein P-II 1 [Ereboglobus sp. PH5-10]|uniref:Transcriptional regulator n=1 Tax=Ereboglobus luteus TaxID=1796921 RepID=A0A2U8E403_9BACT|nr:MULTISPECIES: P-II family nitrogen regulator [Ereboglobus]AWI09648.1 hypothetical protein CKA38_10660 [Ereboglobus luteus]MDF9828077.1 nitrogen regulatory protein P-II 1 [Ereboglobus sp. PH5-10]
MKNIVAFIRPSKEDAVRQALHEMPGVTGATFSDVRGFGRGRGHDQSASSRDEALVGTLRKVRIDLMVPDKHADSIALGIAVAARTGNRGDGKVYILSAEKALRISTGETGAIAV